jgi:hypothetical protein
VGTALTRAFLGVDVLSQGEKEEGKKEKRRKGEKRRREGEKEI